MIDQHLVMIIEDDRDVRESVAEVLEDNWYASIHASNGKEALEKLRAGGPTPCLILLDLMMPIMDGSEFRALQREDVLLRSIPVVVLTAHGNAHEAKHAMQADGWLKKPVSVETLLMTIQQFCPGG